MVWDAWEGKEIEERLEMLEEGYIYASETEQATTRDLNNTIQPAVEVCEEIRLQHLIQDTVEKKVFKSLKEANDKAIVRAYTVSHQMTKKSAAKIVYLGGADVVIKKISESWPSRRNLCTT